MAKPGFTDNLFSDPVESPWCIAGSVGLVSAINKDTSGTRLLPMAILTYPVD